MPRCTIEFNDAADAQLADLTRTLGASSKAEVVRNALSLYAFLVELLKKPHRVLGIIAEDEGNRVEKVILVPGMNTLALQNAPRAEQGQEAKKMTV
jgi:hypothetical protein